MQFRPGEKPVDRLVRFRSLGCYPLSAAVESSAANLREIVEEMHTTRVSERAGRLIDQDQDASMEKKKREGYF
jgi:sulfate adenylyltransferase subunit 2